MLRLISGTIALSLLPLTLMADDTFETEALRWREAHEAKLKADDGWLTLVGLHWLEQGDSPVGSADGSVVQLPATAPAKLGVLKVAGDRVTFTGDSDVSLSKNGKPFPSGDVATDAGGKPDVLAVGTYKLTVIKRGEKLAVRVKDNASPARSDFKGLTWFAPDPSWKIRAKFLPSKGTSLALDTIVGTKPIVFGTRIAQFSPLRI